MLKCNIAALLLVILCDSITGQPLVLSGTGYDMHSELHWNTHTTADRYQIWKKGEDDPQFSLLTSTRKLSWIDWTGREEPEEDLYRYYLEALSVTGQVITSSDTIDVIVAPFTEEEFLDMVQQYTFRYFYEYGHPVSGMARERLGSEDIVTTGGSGFGIMALLVGVERGWISREQGADRMLKIVGFLQFADRFHGVYPHWMNGRTGDVIPFGTFDNGGDLVETAFLMQGLLCARQYFNENDAKENAIREAITGLWEDVEWDHYSRNNSGVLYWHWSPEFEWQMNFQIRGYNEALIIYLLAIASPTHPVDPSYWHTGWAGSGYVNGLTWYGYKLFVGPLLGGPLFFAHYSFMGFDPRDRKDAYANYFIQNRNHTLINRAWCMANPLHHEGYNENSWGLTASDDPWGYFAHAPGATTDNGTLTPAAAIPSMPYTPEESISALKHFYRGYGEELWGEFGFYNAFNPGEGWFADSYIAIDQGPIINMIENYRTGLLWSYFMANPEIEPALTAIGFVADPVSIIKPPEHKPDWKLFPTLSDHEFYIQMPTDQTPGTFTLLLTDALGRNIMYRSDFIADDLMKISLEDTFPVSGWIWVSLTLQNNTTGALPVWIK